jgi:hypothetical protein
MAKVITCLRSEYFGLKKIGLPGPTVVRLGYRPFFWFGRRSAQ